MMSFAPGRGPNPQRDGPLVALLIIAYTLGLIATVLLWRWMYP